MTNEPVVPKPTREPKNYDLKCLDCGAFNIPENLVCGACGASLPVVYDKNGKVFHWESDSPYFAAFEKRRAEGAPAAPMTSVLSMILAVLAAIGLMGILVARLNLPPFASFGMVLLVAVVAVRLFKPRTRG